MSKQSFELLSNNTYKSGRIGPHDYMVNLTSFFFTPEWFTDTFIKLFRYACYILTQGGIYFCCFSFNLLSTHSLVYIALSQLRKFLKNKSLFFLLLVMDFSEQ